ncbi:MAG: SAM-dependent methyltransferase [Rhodopila sp.]|nr:SAM-dependent methyltransferase [Rhodopila sp.]
MTGCRFCAAPLTQTFADLGMAPPSNSFVAPEHASAMEPFYPLHAFVCDQCHLVQLEEFETPEQIFSNYLYFSSFSDSWLKHAEAYTDQMISRFGLGAGSQVVEIGSNDGYLLQYFRARGVPVLGVEPAANVAAAATARGIPTDVSFFGVATARRLKSSGIEPDVIAANNVMAHVPDLNDFVEGFSTLLKPGGVVTVEFPHLLRLMQQNQFDTIYHEHFSYFSLLTVERVFARYGLRLFDVQEVTTHGGSLRIFATQSNDSTHPTTDAVAKVLEDERAAGLGRREAYAAFAEQVIDTKTALLAFCIQARRERKTIAGYGAPAKGNTLLNYCGVGLEFIPFTVDRSPHKQGKLLPGVHIPIRAPEAIFEVKPDYVLILPWNLADEIVAQMAGVRDWGGQFVVPIPTVRII